ncbi:MAG: DNA repair protein RecO, partial [Erysipelotrichales bacterium]
MITKDIKGIVFNILNYKDNDLIVDVFTYDYGFIQLYVKGAQKIKSKSFYIFKLFNEISFDIAKMDLNGLSTYRSGSIIKVFDYTKLDYTQINCSMLISELLVKIKELKDFNIKRYYKDLQLVLSLMLENKTLFHINYFLNKTLIILGSGLVLDECQVCGSKKEIVGFSPILSGFVCSNDSQDDMLCDKDLLLYL